MKKSLWILTAVIAVTSCNRFDIESNTDLQKQKEAQKIIANAEKWFGTIDPNQDWNSTQKGVVSISADAALANIEKVQILTESPFLNSNACVLAEAEVEKGQTVTLTYEAPNAYTRLYAACVDRDGTYYAKGFDVARQSVSFLPTTTRGAGRRAAADELPDASKVKLEWYYPNQNEDQYKTSLSLNAMRTWLANMADDTESKRIKVEQWKGSKWEEDRLWLPSDNSNIGNSWAIKNHAVYRTVEDISEEERTELQDKFDSFLSRTDNASTWGRKDTWRPSAKAAPYVSSTTTC